MGMGQHQACQSGLSRPSARKLPPSGAAQETCFSSESQRDAVANRAVCVEFNSGVVGG